MLRKEGETDVPVDQAVASGLARVRGHGTSADASKPNVEAGLVPGTGAATLPILPDGSIPKKTKTRAPVSGRAAIARTRPKPVPATDTRTGPIPTGQDLIDRSMRRIGSVIDNTQDPNKLAGVIKRTREQMDLDTITKRAVPIQDYTARDRLIKLAGGERYQDVMGCEPSTRFAAALRDEVSRPPSEG